MKKDVLLFSGGLDSFIAYFYLDKPKSLFFNMKQKYADVEISRVNSLKEKIQMDVDIIDDAFDFSSIEREDLVIPNRNIYMTLWGTNYANNVWMAAVDGDYNHDKNPEIFHELGQFCTKLLNRKIVVDSPFWKWTKTDMITWYKDQGYPIEWLKETYSCFTGHETHCGRCTSCLRRWLAMYNNDIYEDYLNDPLTWEVIPKYVNRMITGEQKSDTIGRRKEFIKALFKANYPIDLTDITWIEDLRRNVI